MKIIKSSLLALLGMAVAMTSCSDDNNYNPGAVSDGAFFGESASKIEFSVEESSFPVTVSRTSASVDATVNITAVDESGLFSIPTTASFSGNELTTTINITYDPSEVEQDVNYPITLTVSPSTEYGYSSYSFNAVSPSPWTTLGQCTYTDDLVAWYYTGKPITYKVTIQENDLKKGLYRLVNPYGKVYPYNDPGDWDTSKDYYVVIDATNPERVVLERSETGLDWGDGAVYVWSMAGYYLNRGVSADDIEAQGLFGTFENGIITWPTNSLVFGIIGVGMMPASDGNARIVMPGVVISDYSAQVVYAGRKVGTDDQNYLLADVTLGTDVASARVAAVMTQEGETAAQAVINGSVEYIEITSSQAVEIPIDDTEGIYTLVVVTYNGNGDAAETAYDYVELSFSGKQWQTYGSATIIDGWFLPLYGEDPEDYEWSAIVEESINNPGVYRIVNMFGGDYVLADDMVPGLFNIEINAQDKSFVYIQPQASGLNLGWGSTTISDAAGLLVSQGYTQAEIVEELDADQLSTAQVDEEEGALVLNIGGCTVWMPQQGKLTPAEIGNASILIEKSEDAVAAKASRAVSRSSMSASELNWRLGNHAIFKTKRMKRPAKFINLLAD